MPPKAIPLEASDPSAVHTETANETANESSASHEVSETSARPSAPRLRSIRDRGARGSRPAGLKFQPKGAVRRSKEEREAQERAELERTQKAAAEAAKLASRGQHHGRGIQRGAFRGGMSGWRSQGRVTSGASGHLSGAINEYQNGVIRSGPAINVGSGAGGGRSGTSDGTRARAESGLKAEYGGGARVKSEDGHIDARHGDRTDGRPRRINIEEISLISDDEDELEVGAKGKGRETSARPPGWSLRPVRLGRHEHVDRKVGIDTYTSSSRSTQQRQKGEKVSADGGELTGGEKGTARSKVDKELPPGKDVGKKRPRGVHEDREDGQEQKIKKEPADDGAGSADAPAPVQGASSADSQPQEAAMANNTKPADAEGRKEERPAVAKPKKNRMPGLLPKPVLRTKEDHQEWARHEAGMMALAEELGMTDLDAEGDTAMGEDGEQKRDRKEGLVYYFQFPPLIPALWDREAGAAADTHEPISLDDMQDDAPAASNPAPPIKVEADVKVEEGVRSSHAAPETLFPGALPPDPDATDIGGMIGTLTVYESGDSELVWGGMELVMRKGFENSQLEEVIVSDVGFGSGSGSAGPATAADGGPRLGLSMGQLCANFVLTPSWPHLFAG